MQHKRKISVPAALERFAIQNSTTVLTKINNIRSAEGKYHIVFDFDRTLTAKNPATDSNVTTWQLIKQQLPSQGLTEAMELYKRFRPLERSGLMTPEFATEWWNATLSIFRNYRVNLLETEKHVLQAATIRPGVHEVFEHCQSYDIPTVILSAGIYDVIALWCAHYGIQPSSILSTKLILDAAGYIIGWEKDTVIHPLNKQEKGHPELSFIRQTHPYAIVIGDSMDDAAMVAGTENVLRIRVDNPPAEERDEIRAKSFTKFDLLVESESLEPIAELLTSFH